MLAVLAFKPFPNARTICSVIGYESRQRNFASDGVIRSTISIRILEPICNFALPLGSMQLLKVGALASLTETVAIVGGEKRDTLRIFPA